MNIKQLTRIAIGLLLPIIVFVSLFLHYKDLFIPMLCSYVSILIIIRNVNIEPFLFVPQLKKMWKNKVDQVETFTFHPAHFNPPFVEMTPKVASRDPILTRSLKLYDVITEADDFIRIVRDQILWLIGINIALLLLVMILTPSQTDQGPTLESTTIIRLVVSYFAVILQLGWFGRMIVHYHSKNSGIYRMAVKDVDNSNIRLIESMASIAYVNFDLHIAPGGRVTAISCEGEVTADISTQTPNSIFLAMDLIEKDQTNAELLRDFGNDLFHWLFPPNVHSHLLQTEANARTKNMKVRLRLRVEEKNIARLPLEFIYRSTGNYFMATNPNIVLSRYLNVPLPPKHVDSNGEQLHILAIISDPTDQTRLDPIVWERLLQESLKKLLDNGSISLNTVKNATRKEIRDALLNKKPDIIQFIGHGIYKDDIGYLALVNEYGSTWLVDDSTFANLFMGFDDKLRFICLATCESAKTNNPQGFLGIAPKLVERGTPAVIAMQYKVLIATAKLFLEDFYESLASRKPIDWSTQYARNAISIQFGLHNREFATPVLYMHTPDGKVF